MLRRGRNLLSLYAPGSGTNRCSSTTTYEHLSIPIPDDLIVADAINTPTKYSSRRGRGAGSKGKPHAEVRTGQTEGDCTPPECKPFKGVGDRTHVSLRYTAGKKEHSPCSEAPCSLFPCFLFKIALASARCVMGCMSGSA